MTAAYIIQPRSARKTTRIDSGRRSEALSRGPVSETDVALLESDLRATRIAPTVSESGASDEKTRSR
jgi:hypothetical protein